MHTRRSARTSCTWSTSAGEAVHAVEVHGGRRWEAVEGGRVAERVRARRSDVDAIALGNLRAERGVEEHGVGRVARRTGDRATHLAFGAVEARGQQRERP